MRLLMFLFFFFNDTATTEIYTLSLHDALPISHGMLFAPGMWPPRSAPSFGYSGMWSRSPRNSSGPLVDVRSPRSEEHTSELQSLAYLVCRLLLEKKKRDVVYAFEPAELIKQLP